MSEPRTVRQALDEFKVAMIESNNRYLEEYLERLLARTDIEPDEKDEEFIDFCGGQDAPDLPGPFPTCVEDIPAFVTLFEHEYPHFDGTLPSQPLEIRDAFLEKLQLEINKRADKNLWPDDLVVPDDYKELLSLTNGIYDPDFRRAKPAPINGAAPDEFFEELIVPVKRLGEFRGWEIAGGWRAGLVRHCRQDMHVGLHYRVCEARRQDLRLLQAED